MGDNEEICQHSRLIAQVMGAHAQMTNDVSSRLIDSLTKERNELRAELAIIRDDLNEAFSGDWMPSPRMVFRLMYPTLARIEAHMNGEGEE